MKSANTLRTLVLAKAPSAMSVDPSPLFTAPRYLRCLRWCTERLLTMAAPQCTTFLFKHCLGRPFLLELERELSLRVVKADHDRILAAISDSYAPGIEGSTAFLTWPTAFAPGDLLHRAYLHHCAHQNNYTPVTGLPNGCRVDIIDTYVLRELALRDSCLLPELPGLMLTALQSASALSGEQLPYQLHSRPVDISELYSSSTALIPESIDITDADNCEIANDVSSQEYPSDGLDPFCYFGAWKSGAIRRRDASLIMSSDRRDPLGKRGNRPARVMFVSGASGFSGGEASLCQLVSSLDPARFAAQAAVSRPGVFAERLRAAGAIVHTPGRALGASDLPTLLWHVASYRQSRPDLIHVNGFDAAPAVAAALVCEVPVITHVRSDVPPRTHDELYGSAGIVAVSDFVRREILRFNVDPAKVHVIWNGVDTTTFAPSSIDRLTARERLGLRQDDTVALTVARFTPSKRHDILIDVATLLRDSMPTLKFLWVGEVYEGDSEWFDAISTRIRERQLADIVQIRFFQPDIREALAASDAMVLCSHREPLARCVIEAMAMGLPVVVTDSGGTPEIVDDHQTGYITTYGSAEHTASALARALGPDGAAIGAAARVFAASQLAISEHASRVMALYDQVLSGGSGAI